MWKNTTAPQSTLNKKYNRVAYNKCRECVAMGAAQIAFERGINNLSDCLTKLLTGHRFKKCI